MWNVLEVTIDQICTNGAPVLQIVGYVLTVFKIAIPLLIIAYGVFDLGKVVTTGKDDDMKKQIKVLLYRVIAGIVIFFIPSIIVFIFGLITQYSSIDKENKGFETCRTCVLYPWRGECTDKVAEANAKVDTQQP